MQTEDHHTEGKISHKRLYSFQQADFDPSAVRQKGDGSVPNTCRRKRHGLPLVS